MADGKFRPELRPLPVEGDEAEGCKPGRSLFEGSVANGDKGAPKRNVGVWARKSFLHLQSAELDQGTKVFQGIGGPVSNGMERFLHGWVGSRPIIRLISARSCTRAEVSLSSTSHSSDNTGSLV